MKKVGLIAVLAALICGIAVYFYLGSVEQRINEAGQAHEPELTQVVVANQVIPAYTEITEDMLRFENYPADYVNPQAVLALEDAVGLQSDGTLVEGEQILSSMLGMPEEVGATLSYQIPDGMRAMTVGVGVDSGVGGYIAVGDLIDVMLYMSVDSPAGDGTVLSGTTVVVEAAEVLKTGDATYTREGGIYTSVTLALTPEDCLKLYTAMNQGNLYASLRQHGDMAQNETEFFDTAELADFLNQ